MSINAAIYCNIMDGGCSRLLSLQTGLSISLSPPEDLVSMSSIKYINFWSIRSEDNLSISFYLKWAHAHRRFWTLSFNGVCRPTIDNEISRFFVVLHNETLFLNCWINLPTQPFTEWLTQACLYFSRCECKVKKSIYFKNK